MARTELVWDTRRLFADLKRIHGQVAKEMRKGARDVLDRFHTIIDSEALTMHGPKSLGARTGQLRKALKREGPVSRGGNIVGRVFFKGEKANMLARVHEYGARIKPKTAKFLKVPTESALTPTKRLKKAAALMRKGDKKSFVRKTKSGKLIIFLRTGKGKRAKITPMFILKKNVKIPKRLYFRQRWKKFKPQGVKILNAAYRRALKVA